MKTFLILLATLSAIILIGLVAIPVSETPELPRACASMEESGCPANSIHPHTDKD